MGKIDIIMKEWLEIPEIFAELFNGAVFNGEKRIKVENLIDMNSEYVLSMQTKSVRRYSRK